MHTLVASVQDFGQRTTWPDHVVYVGMPGNAARAFGITDDLAGPFGKPWNLLNDPRGWLIAYREYLWARLRDDGDFALAAHALHGKTLLCYCTRKTAGTRRKDGTARTERAVCHADTLAAAVEWLNGCKDTPDA